MKLAFSTLGCPDWEWNEILATAKDLGFNGVEVRGIANEIYAPKSNVFCGDNLEKTMVKLGFLGLSIPMLTTGIALCEVSENDDTWFNEACEYIDLASKINCPYIRVMITSKPYPENCDMVSAVKRYDKICEYAKEKGVTPLMETNGILSDSLVMLDFMNECETENKGVLWDVHHPYRFFGELPKDTYNNIGQFIKYVHVKDSVVNNDDKIVYRMMGYGDVPVFDALKVLHDNKNDSFISLEWVKRWEPELEGAGIVFAHFINYIKFLDTQLDK